MRKAVRAIAAMDTLAVTVIGEFERLRVSRREVSHKLELHIGDEKPGAKAGLATESAICCEAPNSDRIDIEILGRLDEVPSRSCDVLPGGLVGSGGRDSRNPPPLGSPVFNSGSANACFKPIVASPSPLDPNASGRIGIAFGEGRLTFVDRSESSRVLRLTICISC